jgi:hypothetical protein
MAIIIPGKTVCTLTGRVLQEEDYFVCFPHFISDEDDPLWRYSDSCMLREAFEDWEHREEFLARWADFRRSYVSRFTRRLLDSNNYLVNWVVLEKRVVIMFLKHGFTIGFRGRDWSSVREAFFDTHQEEAIWDNPDGIVRFKKIVSGEVQIEILPHSLDGFAPHDRILISLAEWNSLTDSLRGLEKSFRKLS